MASELANQIFKIVDDEGYYDPIEASAAIDRLALQEVREVLNECIERMVRLGAEDDVKTLGPDPTLQRARALRDRLRIDGGKENDGS
jgi:hypothetical protein